MGESNNLACRLAYLGEGDAERKFLESVSTQISAEPYRVYSAKQLEEYRKFECDYCVIYPATASAEAILSLVSVASEGPRQPKIILLLLKHNTTRLEKGFEELGTRPQILLLENPDILRAVELINSYFILKRQFKPPDDGWEFVGASAPVRKLHNLIKSFARWDKEPVLIFGETGTGKELIARRLHEVRKIGELHAYNLAGIPFELSDNLLFGHTKGIYTDAKTDEEGYIIKAGNGTLLIDEIGEVGIGIQIKLLRTLQDRKVFKLGEAVSKGKEINARFVFATNRDLKKACREGEFREDFFHRISALQIDVPPLRQRKADIPLLVEHFVEEFIKDYAHIRPEIGLDNILKLDVLFDYKWPGNVRELRNIVRQAAALTDTGAIDKKLAELVEKRITEIDANPSQSSLSQGNRHSHEDNSFINSLLDDTWSNATSQFAKTYKQFLFIKTNGNCKKMEELADIKKTFANDIRKNLSLSQFEAGDLIGAASLANKLKQPTDAASSYICRRFQTYTNRILNEYSGGEPDAKLLAALVEELNLRLQDLDLYQAERFNQIQLSEDTQELIRKHGLWTDLFRLNRMLIEDTYPNEILRNYLVRDDSNWDKQADSPKANPD